MTAARLKKGTAQLFRLANSARIFVNSSWYDYTDYINVWHYSTKLIYNGFQ